MIFWSIFSLSCIFFVFYHVYLNTYHVCLNMRVLKMHTCITDAGWYCRLLLDVAHQVWVNQAKNSLTCIKDLASITSTSVTPAFCSTASSSLNCELFSWSINSEALSQWEGRGVKLDLSVSLWRWGAANIENIRAAAPSKSCQQDFVESFILFTVCPRVANRMDDVLVQQGSNPNHEPCRSTL